MRKSTSEVLSVGVGTGRGRVPSLGSSGSVVRKGVLLLIAAALAGCGGGGGGGGGGGSGNSLPVIVTSAGNDLDFIAGQDLTFTVTATDPDGDPVSLRLLNPQTGMAVAPVAGPSPQSLSIRWTTSLSQPSVQLVFSANDVVEPTAVITRTVAARRRGTFVDRIVHGDVTGDGVADTVAVARLAGGVLVTNTGLAFVWSGSAPTDGTPTATLYVWGAELLDQLGSVPGRGLLLADVTGDGLLDVVAATTKADIGGAEDAGAVYVWRGGPALVGPVDATARLTVPGAMPLDELASSFVNGLQIADVTGDGLLDVVAATPSADVGGVADAGAVYVWSGGPSLVGAVAPTATLTVPGALEGDQLGAMPVQAVLLGDVTGDTILDVVAGATLADIGPSEDAGAIYVWAGGPGLVGPLPPTATLTVADSTDGDQLGASTVQGAHLADATSDGVLDVVAVTFLADVDGVANAGAVYVWAGGAALSGPVFPTATLTVPGAHADDHLGFQGESVHFGDVTGDGSIDVLVSSTDVDDESHLNAGAIYLWAGGPSLIGSLGPTATLAVPSDVDGETLTFYAGPSACLADVTGDGVLDVLTGAQNDSVGGVANAGAIYEWTGGPSLTGLVAPSATLTVPGAAPNDSLGVSAGHAIQLGDVSDDGVLDIVASALLADVGGVENAGAIYVWEGGIALVGSIAPTATLAVPGASMGDTLGSVTGQGLLLDDVTDDGVLDVISGTMQADVGGVVDAGAVYVWAGGSQLAGATAPTATLANPEAQEGDHLGYASGESIQVADVTGDGFPDLIATAAQADDGPYIVTGAIYVWEGGVSMTGALAPTATLTVPWAFPIDQLGYGGGQAVQFVDVTGDGLLDVIACASLANVRGEEDAGAIYLWEGGAALSGSVAPTAIDYVPPPWFVLSLGGG